MPTKLHPDVARAKDSYLAAAEQFNAEAGKFLDALTDLGKLDVFFMTHDTSRSRTFQNLELVQFLRTLAAGETVPDFFVFDITAKHKGTPPKLDRNSTIEVTMPEGSHSTRTRKGWSGGDKDTATQITEPLSSWEIGSVLEMIQKDSRSQIKSGNKDERIPTIAACADGIKLALDKTNIAELATEYLELKGQHQSQDRSHRREEKSRVKVEDAVEAARRAILDR